MKKFAAIFLAVALIAASAMAVSAFSDDYPASSKTEGVAAPTDGVIMIGELIGAEGGWGDNPDVGRAAAFDGYLDTFYDPHAASDPTAVAGIKMPEAYILTEIRICPRSGFLSRFNGAAIWGFNGDEFDPNTATLIWESIDVAEEEMVFRVIKPNEFIAGANTGFTSYIYWNEVEHGDVAEVELYGNPAIAPAAAEPEPVEPAPAEAAPVEAAAPTPASAEAAPAPAPAPAAATAPRTSDMSIIISLAVLVATAFVTVKLTRAKNKM